LNRTIQRYSLIPIRTALIQSNRTDPDLDSDPNLDHPDLSRDGAEPNPDSENRKTWLPFDTPYNPGFLRPPLPG
jgi:hypothetical protein